MKRTTLLSLSLFVVLASLLAQPCKVSIDSLKGEYKGECSKGKAEGKGTAKGADFYTGDFRDGYPDGTGKYTWKNGDWYEGGWKKGLFDGNGTLHNGNNKTDSTVELAGFWKKGKYIGRYEKPYVINSLTNAVSGLNIRKQKTGQPEITITVKSVTGGASSFGKSVLPKCRLTDIQLIEGRFQQQVSDESSSPITNKYILRQVTYPFHAILSFESIGAALPRKERIAVEILENGNWYIQVDIDN